MDKGYKKLLVWQRADEFAYQVYLETKKFPKDELYGMTSQLRRAAISVPTNIVEGVGRQGRGELKQFTRIALGSLAEAEYLLEFSLRLSYLDDNAYDKLENLRQNTGGLLWNFYKSL
ncbi:MAG: four helix bundle protein [Planctomycetes bacterium RIFCSPLOWO2_12_FULL_39_13]|nr:MAG: four helix bundle protein [Planctomycetes bacterium RIFCSPLOWO2_12_FULL_39_13]